MLTRSTRKLPPDFNENQPIGRKKTLNPRDERQHILATHPTLPAAFPTLDCPPPSSAANAAARPLWRRGASAGGNNAGDDINGGDMKRKRIDMNEDDLFKELMGDNTFLNASAGCAEAVLPNFGQGDYCDTFTLLDSDQGLPLVTPLDPLKPGELDLPLFWDEDSSDNWGHNIPPMSSFRDLASGVKMAIMIEAVAAYKINKAPEMLMLTLEDIDDYVELYEREAVNDAANAYNMKKEHEWEAMHRMNGRTDFEMYDPPERRLTFRSALSLIRRKDVDAGARYLIMAGQDELAAKLYDYVGCAAPGAFAFKHPKESKRGGGVSHEVPLPILANATEALDNISVASTDEEIVVRDRRRRRPSDTYSVVSTKEVLAVQNRVRGRPRLSGTPNSMDQAVTDFVDDGQKSKQDNVDGIPLLARLPKRRKLQHGRPEQLQLPQLSTAVGFVATYARQSADASPEWGPEEMAALARAHTPPPSVTELVREMSSTTRRSICRPSDEPMSARNITFSPIPVAFAEPRRPRVAHLDRPGQNPTRHSSGSYTNAASNDNRAAGGAIVRTDLKIKRQLSGVYRPDRQWADQLHSSSPMRATTPKLATQRSGSKEFFLSEQQPSHPLTSPRLFDEGGKTVRDRPQSAEEVQRIFKMQEDEARKRRLGQVTPRRQEPSLPPSTTPAAYQAAFLGQNLSKQSSSQDVTPAQTTPRQAGSAIPQSSTTPRGYQPQFSGQNLSKHSTGRNVAPYQTPPRQPGTLTQLSTTPGGGYQPPFSAHMMSKKASNEDIAPAPSTSSGLRKVTSSGISSTAGLSSHPQLQQAPPQPANQKAESMRPGVLGHADETRPMKQRVRRTKTNPARAESTAGRLSPPMFDSNIQALGTPKFKSTYKQQPQCRQDERELYQPPPLRRESGSRAVAANVKPLSIPATPRLPNHQAQPNAVKRAHTMHAGLPGLGHGILMAGQHQNGFGYYNNDFPATPTSTFQGTVKKFSRDPPKAKHPNQFTSAKASALQGPADFSAPHAQRVVVQKSAGDVPATPNPFRTPRQSFQAPPADVPAVLPPSGALPAQYHHQQAQQPPAKEQIFVHEPQPSPDRPLWDRNNRNSSPVTSYPMPGAFPQTPDASSRELTPQPNMPGGCLSGVLALPNSSNFAQQMKNMGVPFPGQLVQTAGGWKGKKRNVASKVQVPLPMTASNTAPPTAPGTPVESASVVIPKRGRGRGRPPGSTKAAGSLTKKNKGAGDPRQATISQFFSPPGRLSGGSGIF